MNPNGLHISPIKPTDFDTWVNFSLSLFPNSSKDKIEVDLRRIEQLDKYQTFIARKDSNAIGYVTVTLRTDHVEGASTSPVGYLEAIYVKPEYRNDGIARELFLQGQAWCKENGCSEMGSDTWHWNKDAQAFHKKLGFKEEDILVHFYKKIDP
ncbi:MAG: GNAT family N-acetyltransferase [Bacteroidia bacterium]|nr:GNAT family N-acetyltransferase [Bacteroidia bacterium]